MQYISVKWKRPFSLEQVQDALNFMAETRPRNFVVFEIISRGGKVQYLLGAEEKTLKRIQSAFKAHGDIKFGAVDENTRPRPTYAKSLKLTHNNLTLNTEIAEAMLRAGLATLASLSKSESAVIQIIFGAAYPPSSVGGEQLDPDASWMDIALGHVKKATASQTKSFQRKAEQYRYDAVVRIGTSGFNKVTTMNELTGVFRTMSSISVQLKSKDIAPTDIINTKIPWRLPLRLTVEELACMMLLPSGEDELPGVGSIHPLELGLPSWYHPPREQDGIKSSANLRTFATADDGSGRPVPLTISPKDALEHTIITGSTGAGKSTVMLNLIMSDIKAGRGLMVIDPKQDLVNDILAAMPEERLDDLVVIDPSSDMAVGWNPLDVSDGGRINHPALTADAILAVFRDIFDNWGIRAQDILSAALLTLAQRTGATKDATLLWLTPMLMDSEFRKKIVSKSSLDLIALKPFWDFYDSLREGERRAMIESTLNKIRQIMYRPAIRNILGQAHPKFHLSDLFNKRKIVLVPLNKGLIGEDSARLLGSLLVGLTWIEALKRADLPPEERHMVSLYIDELQDYVSLPGSFADSLAQARSLGLAITMAHQYRAQLDQNLREGIDANARNKIVFNISASDATAMANLAPELKPVDFLNLPRYHIYSNFMSGGRSTGWVSATTLPPPAPIRLSAEAKAYSLTKYGTPSEVVEAEIIKTIHPKQPKSDSAKAVIDPELSDLDEVEAASQKHGSENLVIGLRHTGQTNGQKRQGKEQNHGS